MDENTILLKEILEELKKIGSNLEAIRTGEYDSLEYICQKLYEIKEK